MSPTASAAVPPAPRRRCRPRGVAPGALRPTDVLAAFFLLGVAYLAAGALVAGAYGVTGWSPGRWLAVHLVFVGGISQLVLGASQFFVGAFLATDPPARALVRAQLILWNLGTLAVAASVVFALPAGAEIGALGLAAALVLYARGLRGMERRSLQRARWAVRWYYACAALLVPGLAAGALIARGTTWPGVDLLGAHLTLNLAGWLGTAIVGTLHTFFPSLTATRLSFPRLEGWTLGGWAAGVCTVATGVALGHPALATAGWLTLLGAAACLGANVVGSLRAAPAPLPLPARLVAVGQAALVAGVVIAVATTAMTGGGALAGGAPRGAMAALLIAGWIGLTVLGSLLHLLSILLRVRAHRTMPTARPKTDGALVALAATGVAALAATQLLELEAATAPAAAVVLAVYGLLAGRVLALAARVARVARPSV